MNIEYKTLLNIKYINDNLIFLSVWFINVTFHNTALVS